MRRGLGAGCVALALVLAACGGTGTPSVSAPKLLSGAEAALNATNSVHFVITSTNSGGGSVITGGNGYLVRPAGITGSFDVSLSGLPVTLKVLGQGSKFYVQLFGRYVQTDPAKYDIANPAQFLSRTDGLSQILGVAEGAKVTGTTRLSGELLDQVNATVPGNDIPVISDLAPAKPVQMTADIDPGSHQLRQVTLTGPFVVASSDATYVVTLTDYGKSVRVTLPGS